jgi:hypothetical protein
MERSVKVLESFHLRGTEEVRTLSIYNGGPLGEEMEAYHRALQPGGRCYHVTKELGYAPVPVRAILWRGHVRGKILERWAAA